jgi:hypothetical protein
VKNFCTAGAIMSKPVLETAPRIRVRVRWICMGIGCLPIVLVVVGWVLLDRATESRLERAIAEADITGSGWRQADLWANRVQVPAAENSALRLQTVIDQLPSQFLATQAATDTPAAKRLSELSGRLSRLDPLRRLSDEDGRQLHEDLETVKPARLLALELAGMPYGRYAVASRYLYTQEPTDHAEKKVRRVVRLLQLEAVDRIQRRDTDGALEACCAILNAGRSIGDEPNLIPQLVRIAADGVALFTMQRALAQGPASDRALVKIQECLARESEEPLALFALKGDRATVYHSFEGLATGELTLGDWAYSDSDEQRANSVASGMLPRMFIKYNQAVMLESTNRSVDIARQPDWEQADLWAQYEADRKSRGNRPARMISILADLLAPAHGVAGLAFLRVKALLRVGRVMVAVERFRLAHGRWPEAIDTLVPRFLEAVPIDPFTGRELILKELGDGVAIYSLGADQMDNHGKFEPRGRVDPGYDLGYRLWGVKLRGRPPER